MASDLLALLDTLDVLHKDTPEQLHAELDIFDPDEREIEATIRDEGVTVLFTEGTGVTLPRGDGPFASADVDARWAAARASRALAYAKALAETHNAYPRLAQALRTALTPTTDGEREAREALARYDSDPYHGDPQEQDIDVDHLRTALALLATERAKVADAARERDELRAQLTALRSVPDGVIRNVGDGRAVFSITLTTPPPHIGPDPVDVAARTRTLTPKVTP